MRIAIFGATGAVGQTLVPLACAQPFIHAVLCPTRKALDFQNPKLTNPVHDLVNVPPNESWWETDAVVCVLGTTLKKAGSKEGFVKVDHDLPLAIAKAAQARSVPHFVFLSALGAQGKSSFYLKVKAKTEEDLMALGFPQLTLVRPSPIDTKRNEKRWGEEVGLWASKVFDSLIPRSYKPVTPHQIASAIVNSLTHNQPGVTYVESKEICALPRRV